MYVFVTAATVQMFRKKLYLGKCEQPTEERIETKVLLEFTTHQNQKHKKQVGVRFMQERKCVKHATGKKIQGCGFAIIC